MGNEKVKNYLLKASALLATSTSVNAGMVYTDISPDTVLTVNDVYELDLDKDGASDFRFEMQSYQFGTGTNAVIMGSFPLYSVGGPSNAPVAQKGFLLYYADELSSGYSITSGMGFANNTGTYPGGNTYRGKGVLAMDNYNSYTSTGNSYMIWGNFKSSVDKFIGVRFEIAGSLHYGWIRVDCSVRPMTLTIKDFAYNDVADASMVTSTLSSIENVMVDEFKAYVSHKQLIIDVDFERVDVFNMMGQKAKSASLSSGRVDLSELEQGIYNFVFWDKNKQQHSEKLMVD